MKKEDYVRKDMIEAMKAHNQETKDTLSLLLSALKNAEIEKRSALTEDEENAIVYKEIKQTKETLELCPKDRTDIIEQCTNRIKTLEKFAPEQMCESDIKDTIIEIMNSLGFNSDNLATKKDKGKIMKVLMPKVKGKADGKLVNTILDGELSHE